ncbi:MAG: hypothetical protein P1V36_16740 [Planctomycetota bacterium]|nr:hypothetical protein [Planctomycetota bacterium]
MPIRTVLLLLLLGPWGAACGRTPAGDAPKGRGSPDRPAPVAVTNDARFHAALRTAVADYGSFGEVDDIMRWVPGMCRMVQLDIHVSRSPDKATHGDKLFWMFAKDRQAYVDCAQRDQPVGQILVKEAWASRPATSEEVEHARAVSRGQYAPAEDKRMRSITHRTLERDGAHYTADHVKGLYVMRRLAADTPGTDAGWIYGTLSPDGTTVTSAGRVASCMRCHAEAPRDRMFGLPAR